MKDFADWIGREQRSADRLDPALAARWCATFDSVIGPFEAKYTECQEEVVRMAEHGKEVYQKSFQKLIDDFGYHPAFKRWFDDF